MCFHGEVERTPLQIAKDNVTAGKQDVKYWTDADKVSPGAYTSNLKEAKATLANANKALAKLRAKKAAKKAKRQLQTA